MSISAYVGLPGHGKSYGAVQNVIIPALKQGRRVFTNIPFDEDLFIKDFGISPISFSTKDVQENQDWFTEVFIPGSVLVFDEIWRLWPAGLKANNFLEKHKEFLAEHRHFVGDDGFSTEIYLVTQDLSQVANFPRSLIETTYRMVKRVSIGFDKRFRVDIYEGAVTGSKPPVSKRIRELHGGKFSSKIWKYYKSHTKSQTGLAGNESRTDQRNNALGRTSIKLGFLFFILACPFIYYAFNSVLKKYGAAPVESVSVAIPQSVSQPVQPKKRKEFPDFLSKAKQFAISHTIKTNNITETFFTIDLDGFPSIVSSRDLQKLGYKVMPLNQCLMLVQGSDFANYVVCNRHKESGGFVKSMIVGESDA